MRVAIIPARGGSKSVPKKNLARIGDKSLVEWSIFHGKRASTVDLVCVSSDSDEILTAGERAGADVLIERPSSLSGDEVLDFPVFEHAIDVLRKSVSPSLIVHLRPTAPYRKSDWIDDCVKLLEANQSADSVRSVSLVDQHPYRMYTLNEASGFLDHFLEDHELAVLRRQDHPDVYSYNCVIDVTRVRTLEELRSMTGSKILPYVLPPEIVFDIDTARDLEVTRYMCEHVL